MCEKKKEYFKPGPMTEGRRNIIRGLLEEYDVQSAADIEEALKDLLGSTMDIYGFDVSEGFISDVTDKLFPQMPIKNQGGVYGELAIMCEGWLPEEYQKQSASSRVKCTPASRQCKIDLGKIEIEGGGGNTSGGAGCFRCFTGAGGYITCASAHIHLLAGSIQTSL